MSLISRVGAMNLLKDFDGVSEWISACEMLQPADVETLTQHEVLKMCEGVAKILLRKPDEVISMAFRATTRISTGELSKQEPFNEFCLPFDIFRNCYR